MIYAQKNKAFEFQIQEFNLIKNLYGECDQISPNPESINY